MTIATLLHTWLTCKKVGTDQFGNRYYISKSKNAEGKFKRSVIYNGLTDASKVPPMWHAWLHYMSDEIPVETRTYYWQKEHVPNLTGTSSAYQPDGHISRNEEQKNFTNSNYQAWKP